MKATHKAGVSFCHADDRSGAMTQLVTHVSSPYMEREVTTCPFLSLYHKTIIMNQQKAKLDDKLNPLDFPLNCLTIWVFSQYVNNK